MVLVTTICRQINGLSSSATHQDLSTTVTLRQLWTMPRVQATGSIEVRGEGSALGQRRGARCGREVTCGEALLFNRLLEKLGKRGCRLYPFPPLQASLEAVEALRAAIKTA